MAEKWLQSCWPPLAGSQATPSVCTCMYRCTETSRTASRTANTQPKRYLTDLPPHPPPLAAWGYARTHACTGLGLNDGEGCWPPPLYVPVRTCMSQCTDVPAGLPTHTSSIWPPPSPPPTPGCLSWPRTHARTGLGLNDGEGCERATAQGV